MDKKIFILLNKRISLIQCKNNKKIYYSHECPFCDYKSDGRIFRLNTKLKVGKSFCCGNSFKERYKLEVMLEHFDLLRHVRNSRYSNMIIRYVKDDGLPF